MDNVNTGESKLKSVLAGPAVFAHAMLAARLHVGMGGTPVCATCGVTWPCSTEQEGTRG